MKTTEFISLAKNSFRQLRKGGEPKYVKDIAIELGISWTTANSMLEELKSMGYIKETFREKIMINPDFTAECFAGVYLSSNSICFSVIDFSGKEIYFKSQNFDDAESFYSILKGEIALSKGIKAISICSDNLLVDSYGNAIIPNTIFLDACLIKKFSSEEPKVYFEKAYISNSWKCYEDYGFKDDVLDIVISCYEDNCRYTIWNNGKIIQKREYPVKSKDVDALYTDAIAPIWKVINPSNIILLPSSEDSIELMKWKVYEWYGKLSYMSQNYEQVFEGNKSTTSILIEQPRPATAAALYAMYNYYGWVD